VTTGYFDLNVSSSVGVPLASAIFSTVAGDANANHADSFLSARADAIADRIARTALQVTGYDPVSLWAFGKQGRKRAQRVSRLCGPCWKLHAKCRQKTKR
jgi:hypothetical protein